MANTDELNIAHEILSLQSSADRLLKQTYKLNLWQKVQIAEHPDRPKFLIIYPLSLGFCPLAGDRRFGDDKAIVGGLGYFNNKVVMVVGQQKDQIQKRGLSTILVWQSLRVIVKLFVLWRLANRFNIPILSFVDTAGAYPGIDAEERGQAEAIARSIETCLRVKVPLVSIVIGEEEDQEALLP